MLTMNKGRFRLAYTLLPAALAIVACGAEDPSANVSDDLVFTGYADQSAFPEGYFENFEPATATDDAQKPRSVLVLDDGAMYEENEANLDFDEPTLRKLLEEVDEELLQTISKAESSPKRVLGSDGRWRINQSSLDDFPFRAIGRLSNGCTGVLIGPR
ncbi:MAG: hypothetical protein AAFN74_17915, partial [Myxococcota bacterium]